MEVSCYYRRARKDKSGFDLVRNLWLNGLRYRWSCFGSGGQLNPDQSTAYTTEIVRDSVLLLVALALARWPRGRLAVDNWIAGDSIAGNDQFITDDEKEA